MAPKTREERMILRTEKAKSTEIFKKELHAKKEELAVRQKKMLEVAANSYRNGEFNTVKCDEWDEYRHLINI